MGLVVVQRGTGDVVNVEENMVVNVEENMVVNEEVESDSSLPPLVLPDRDVAPVAGVQQPATQTPPATTVDSVDIETPMGTRAVPMQGQPDGQRVVEPLTMVDSLTTTRRALEAMQLAEEERTGVSLCYIVMFSLLLTIAVVMFLAHISPTSLLAFAPTICLAPPTDPTMPLPLTEAAPTQAPLKEQPPLTQATPTAGIVQLPTTQTQKGETENDTPAGDQETMEDEMTGEEEEGVPDVTVVMEAARAAGLPLAALDALQVALEEGQVSREEVLKLQAMAVNVVGMWGVLSM